MGKLLIVIPRIDLSGPVRGAIAIANGLTLKGVPVMVISLKSSLINTEDLGLRKEVLHECLNMPIFWKKKRSIITWGATHLLSIGFSADLYNLFFGKKYVQCTSIRGDLLKNYSSDYGDFLGALLSKVHYRIISKISIRFSLSKYMQKMLLENHNIKSVLNYNFIDETTYRRINYHFEDYAIADSMVRFIFIGSLSKRKRIMEVIGVFKELQACGRDINLTILGDGPLRPEVISVSDGTFIRYLGSVSNPIEELLLSDCFILFSTSEGVSRASLEALYFNKFSILSDIDANRELIRNGINGFLVKDKKDLKNSILKYLEIKSDISRTGFLIDNFRQDLQIDKMIEHLSL